MSEHYASADGDFIYQIKLKSTTEDPITTAHILDYYSSVEEFITDFLDSTSGFKSNFNLMFPFSFEHISHPVTVLENNITMEHNSGGYFIINITAKIQSSTKMYEDVVPQSITDVLKTFIKNTAKMVQDLDADDKTRRVLSYVGWECNHWEIYRIVSDGDGEEGEGESGGEENGNGFKLPIFGLVLLGGLALLGVLLWKTKEEVDTERWNAERRERAYVMD